MDLILPDRTVAEARGWTHQVQWEEDGKPCFIRCMSGEDADRTADQMKRLGADPVVFDLRDALQTH